MFYVNTLEFISKFYKSTYILQLKMWLETLKLLITFLDLFTCQDSHLNQKTLSYSVKAFSNLCQIFLPCTHLTTFIIFVHNCKLNLSQNS